MDFFAQQDTARRHTTRLVFLFLLAVLAIVLSVNLVSAIAYKLAAADAAPAHGKAVGVPAALYLFVTVGTLAIIGIGGVVQMIGMASGGPAVAKMLGARPVSSATRDLNERRLINVVEEMAIASGVSVPQVFVMDGQPAINAFAAGFSPNEAAVVVTRGTLETLNRDELQGVIGHEFSHILNGDMRLNMRLMGVLGGILVIATIGRMVAEIEHIGAWIFGMALVAIGYIGVFFARIIQASVSRQREFLADASSVQFTRNPDGIGGALAKIGRSVNGARIDHPRADEASHMFFGEAIRSGVGDLMATHPPIYERLERVYGRRVAINDIVARSAPIEPAPQDAAVSGFAGGEEFGRSANGRRIDPAEKTIVATQFATVTGAIGTVSTGHVDHAAYLLARIPPQLRELMQTAQGAARAMLGLVFALGGPVRQVQEELLRSGGEDAGAVAKVAADVQALGKVARLPLISLATPVLKGMAPGDRAAFLAQLRQLIEADRRVTLEEFVLATMLEASLAERAGRAVPMKYRSLELLIAEFRQVLSLVAHAATGDSADAFAKGAKEAGLAMTLIDAGSVKIAAVKEALVRLNQLALMQKPRVIKALTQCALADGKLSLAEAELLRAMCATLDSPMPPFVETMPYTD